MEREEKSGMREGLERVGNEMFREDTVDGAERELL